MSYGIRVKSSSGDVLMSTENLGSLVADYWTAPGGTSASKSYPEWSGFTIIASAIPLHDGSAATGGHTISVSGTTVTATPTPKPPDHLTQVRPPSIVTVIVRD